MDIIIFNEKVYISSRRLKELSYLKFIEKGLNDIYSYYNIEGFKRKYEKI